MRLDDAAARAAAVALSAAALLAAGCGGDDGAGGDAAGPLRWKTEPTVLTNPSLPDDRIMQGRVVNDSLKPVELKARDLKAEDGAGRPVRVSAVFLAGFGRAWEVYNKGPLNLPDAERRRLGQIVRIEPGKDAPLTVSWSGPAPERIRYRGGALPVP
jgi:hypothetical protein